MSTVVETIEAWPDFADVPRFFPPPNGLLPPPFSFAEIDQEWTSDDLEYSDGEPMDSDWERMAIALLGDETGHRLALERGRLPPFATQRAWPSLVRGIGFVGGRVGRSLPGPGVGLATVLH